MTFRPDYADSFDRRLEEAREIANEARSKRGDPKDQIEIPVAEDMAERCEKLLEREYGDKIHGLANNIRDLEADDSVDGREEMSLVLAEEFATGDLSTDFDSDAERVEAAIRTAVAILTEGVVAAPIEGIGVVEVDKNDDGSNFMRIPYFGPIRSAGGTAQAVSVLVADYVRKLLDISVYQPRDEEIERYVEEIQLYDSAVGMQYCPSKKKGRFIVEHTPIMVDGTPNANAVGREVDGYRDLERIEGNHPRDGMCLVMAEGIGLKAPKLKRYADAFDLESWSWLDKLIQEEDDEDEENEDDGKEEEIKNEIPIRFDEMEVADPNKKFMGDAIAGRPLFAQPAEEGAFRLRYGRGRNCGHAAVGISPSTMVIANDFIAPSTQLKTERPGKAAGAAPVDEIEGPTVKLKSGELTRVDDVEVARELQDRVEEIVDLGEIGIPYGEFVENNHPLVPSSYTPDWWERELEDSNGNSEDYDHQNITTQEAIECSKEYDIPLHPEYTYLWHDIEPREYAALRGALNQKEKLENSNYYEMPDDIHSVLKKLLVPHKKKVDRVEIKDNIVDILELCTTENPVEDDVLYQVNETSPFTVRARAPTRVGARMGRPEKAERREMKPVVHSLFPIRDAGGDVRRIDKAANNDEGADNTLSRDGGGDYEGRGVVNAQIAHRKCPKCKEVTWKTECPDCEIETEPEAICPKCEYDGQEVGEICKSCGTEIGLSNYRNIDINKAFSDALDNIDERKASIGNVKGVKRLTSESKIPEPLEKGLLRAKHDVSVFRDGTARYDMCDLPLTSFKPKEIETDVETLKELGYKETLNGKELTSENDLLEMKMQDVIVCDDAGEYLHRVANYVDDLLVKYYDMDPYYEADKPEDLIGCLMIGMAPHTSAGVLGRLLGFTEASANYAHPFFHASKRRNCFHPDTELNVKLDNNWTKTTFQDLVESYLEPDSDGFDDTYDDGTKVQSIKNHPTLDEVRVPSMSGNGYRKIENVTHLSKHPAPTHMVNIRTESGEELTVTPDHEIPVLDEKLVDVSIIKKRAHEIQTGDEVFKYDDKNIQKIKDGIEGSNILQTSKIKDVEYCQPDIEHTYDVTVENTHRLETNGIVSNQCDGDEDSVMLLLDGLINFSREYLPDQRGKNMMDAPIVMSSVIDPEEIDDEAHNVDIVPEYTKNFYESTLHAADPDNADIEIAEERLDEPTGFKHSLSTSNINGGPDNTAYKTLGDMDEKLQAQLELSENSRGVDEKKVASLVIEKHFFPDIIGNLTAFSRQEFMCRECGGKHRRAPCNGKCIVRDDCNGEVSLTVYEGMVDKYVGTAQDMADKYELQKYTKQRLELLSERIESLFKDDKEEQSAIQDFI